MDGESFAIVYNIPEDLSLSEIRHFFSTFIESERFGMFHYLGRKQRNEEDTEDVGCCIVKLNCEFDLFKEEYHEKEWKENTSSKYCMICGPISKDEIDLKDKRKKKKEEDIYQSVSDHISKRKTKFLKRSERKSQNSIEMNNDVILELIPPEGLPNGNIGTPVHVLMKMIQKCILPASMITHLGISNIECIHL